MVYVRFIQLLNAVYRVSMGHVCRSQICNYVTVTLALMELHVKQVTAHYVCSLRLFTNCVSSTRHKNLVTITRLQLIQYNEAAARFGPKAGPGHIAK